MANWFSDHFGTDGDNDTSLPVTIKTLSAGVNHAKVRYKRAGFTGMPLASSSDVIRWFTLKSGDRLLELMWSSNGGSSAGNLDFGLYTYAATHDGAVLDTDLFGSAVDVKTAAQRTSCLIESAVLQHEDVGKTLWEMYAVGAGSDTVDPAITYEIGSLVTTDFATADSILVLEAYYTSE